MLILLTGRLINALVPFTLGEAVKVFEEGSVRSPWPYLFAYVGLRFLQGSGGLNAVRDVSFLSEDRETFRLIVIIDPVGARDAVFGQIDVSAVFRSSTQLIFCFPYAS